MGCDDSMGMKMAMASEHTGNTVSGLPSGKHGVSLQEFRRTLAFELGRGVQPPDGGFDQYLPEDLRALSSRHWTPLHAVSRGIRWLERAGARSVVDIGSGVGKFCVAGALAGRMSFIGLEQRPRLVACARDLARQFAVDDRVQFIEGVFGETAVPVADAYYFFNPFGENIFGREDHVDEDVVLDRERYLRDLERATAFLKALPEGALVLTYHGFGGRMPGSFDETQVEGRIAGLLRLYTKTDRKR